MSSEMTTQMMSFVRQQCRVNSTLFPVIVLNTNGMHMKIIMRNSFRDLTICVIGVKNASGYSWLKRRPNRDRQVRPKCVRPLDWAADGLIKCLIYPAGISVQEVKKKQPAKNFTTNTLVGKRYSSAKFN